MSGNRVLIAAIWLILSTGAFAAPPQEQATPANDQIELASSYLKRGERANALAVIEAAVKADPKPYAISRYLHAAIQAGNTDHFAVLVETGARVGKDYDEFLLYVISQRETPTVGMVALLIEKGARVNQRTTYNTALMHAASGEHLDIAKFLLAKGAEVNAQTDEGTALMNAVNRGNPEMVKLLLDHGADLNAKHRLGNTPLIMSADRSFVEMNAKAGGPPPVASSEIMRLLLAKGANPNEIGQYGRTALMEASSTTKVTLLLARGAQLNTKDEQGETALTRAVDRGDLAVVEALLKAGAEGLNAQNADGETLLMRAVREDRTDLAKSLLTHGADPNLVDVLGDTVLVIAYEKGLSEIKALSRSVDPAKITPVERNAWLRAAIAKKDELKVKELLAAGADANHKYAIGYRHPNVKGTVLIDGVNVGHTGIVQLLLARGADPSVKGLLHGSERGLVYGTALDAAELSKNAEIIALLRNAVTARK
ncbi:MAG TPA: ankyrin repeat domain-containing protein [Pyrinomonadaceae bacterium]|nr:ankyrin repeat domain-containing protein [Pyrinomonadaceae bacterium]